MDETAETTKPDWVNNSPTFAGERTDDFGDEDEDGECDGDDEAWNMLTRSFRQAQTVLDENRALIDEVNSNHESKIPDNMVKNVSLMTQIHGNISKVRSIYSDLSVNFCNIVRQRRVAAVNHRNRDGDEAENPEDDSTEHVLEKSEMVELMDSGMYRTSSTRRYEEALRNCEAGKGKGERTRIEHVCRVSP
ncbi:protein ELF4-LIKE 1-like [Vigna radiata var. radiata]|uniref:Protein ELF4-LIKE 1-like n=1 Tax=Vigna radiata var. radiata TaxID=3916 RepID=A0A3Q0F5I5_VIGRR|nr:protein ELF4-LIKE 1-like [Vigna radiata var. radiata]